MSLKATVQFVVGLLVANRCMMSARYLSEHSWLDGLNSMSQRSDYQISAFKLNPLVIPNDLHTLVLCKGSYK